ncbi:MAG: hypothetical protein ACRDLL_14720 [Solirubrobacterales bacterium]
MKQIRKRLTYANVMSSVAVFLVLGGGAAYAAKKVGSNEIKGNSITTGKIKKEAVTKAKIKKASVDASKLANNAVTTSKIADDAVTGEKVKESTLGTVPDASKLGGLEPGAYQSRVRWALVDSTASGNEGQILAQSGGVSVAPGGTTGFSYLNWGENIGSRALSVSVAQISAGFITVTPCGNNEAPADTTCSPTGTNNPNHTIVRMDDPGNTPDNQIYFISVTK